MVPLRSDRRRRSTMMTQRNSINHRRATLKRTSDVITEIPTVNQTLNPARVVEQVQPRKHRRLTSEPEETGNTALLGRTGRRAGKQRRISDVFELRRNRPSPPKKPVQKVLSPRSKVLQKMDQLPQLMMTRSATPERMLTRGMSVGGIGRRRRTLA